MARREINIKDKSKNTKNQVSIEKLSVVILSYNTRKTTLECLKNLYQHAPTLCQLEVIVVDNGSRDGSSDAIEEKFPQTKLICNLENRGFAAACNQALNKSEGDFILLLNSDTQLIDQSIDYALDYMVKNNDIGVVGGKMIGLDGETQPSCHRFPCYSNLFFSKSSFLTRSGLFKNKFSKFRKIPDKISDVDALSGGFLFLRKEMLNEIGFLDERFFFYIEDIDLCKRARDNNWRVVFMPEVRVRHVWGKSTGKCKSKAYWWHHQSIYRYFAKHHRKYWPLNLLLGLSLILHYAFWSIGNLFKGDKKR